MGLDMFLYARKHVSSTPVFSEATGVAKVVKGGRVAQWRKANQIHNWFVQNVQDGEDDCEEYYVSREQIAELLDTCKKVKANPDLAESLLPPVEGFFFGSTEIDEYYWEDIDLTIKQLEKAMEKFDDKWSYEYSSSW
jgi:hypothetical protein